MTEIRKDRKYILQFPEGTKIEEQKMVINKMEESLKSEDRFTVVDPRVKIYDAEKVTQDVPAEPEKTTEAPAADVTTTEETNITTTETPAATTEAPADNVKVETVTVSNPESDTPPPKADPLSQSGSSDQA